MFRGAAEAGRALPRNAAPHSEGTSHVRLVGRGVGCEPWCRTGRFASSSRSAIDGVRRHRQRAECASVDERLRGRACFGNQPGEVQQWDEVIRCRDREREVGMPGQLKYIGGVGGEHLSHGFVESLRPVEPAGGLVPCDSAEVVHDVPASDDQDTAASCSGASRGPRSRWVSNGSSALIDSWSTGTSAPWERRARAPTRCRDRVPNCLGRAQPNGGLRSRRSRRRPRAPAGRRIVEREQSSAETRRSRG